MRSNFVLLILSYLFSTTYSAAGAAPPECGRVDEAQLRNGEILTQPNEHQWIGKLEDDQQQFLCVAVLIDASHALTAAQCASKYHPEIKNIIFGDWNRNTSASITAGARQKFPVKNIKIHPDYRLGGLYENDLAIIELEEKVVYTDFVQPICLPSIENQKPSENLTVVGFVFKRSYRFFQLSSLQNGRVKVPFNTIPIEKCLDPRLPMGLTCGHSSHLLSSGSALVEAVGNPKKFHLIGIVVAGSYYGPEKILLHVNILPRLDWILRNIGE